MRVAVIGAGTIGSFASYFLSQQEHATVDVFEQFHPGHDLGAAGGENRLYTRVTVLPEQYDRLLESALSRWSDLERLTGRQLLYRGGHLTVTRESLQSEPSTRRRFPQDNIELLTQAELSARFPFQQYFDGDIGIFDASGGTIRSDLSIITAMELAQSHGAKLYTRALIERVEQHTDGVHLWCGGEQKIYDRVLVTAGSWTTRLLPELEASMSNHTPVSNWYIPSKQKFEDASWCAAERVTEDQFYCAPTFDTASLKLGFAGGKQPLVTEEHVQGSPTVHPDVDAYFQHIIETYFPDFYPHPVRTQQYREAYTRSDHPVLSHVSKGVVVASGFSGRGFKFAPAYGAYAAELVANDEIDYQRLGISSDVSNFWK